MKAILLAVAFAAMPAFAHDHEDAKGHHAEDAKGHHAGDKSKPKDAPRSFDKQPAQGTWAKCAVSGDVFQVGSETEFATYNGRTYAFCCPDCKPDFEKDPAKYSDKG